MATLRPWEPELVETARRTGMARVVDRCSSPASLEVAAERSDALFIGSDTPWVTSSRISSLSRLAPVFGVVADGRDPIAALFTEGGAASVLDESAPPTAKLAAALGIAQPPAVESRTAVITVTGPRGAPGRSEVAFALAWMSHTDALVAELDPDAPGLGIRCGLPPMVGPSDDLIQTVSFDRISIFTPPLRGGPLSRSMIARVLDAARSTHRTIVLDVGPNHHSIVGTAVVVCEPSPVGIVRCARFLDTWGGPQPLLVVNRTRDRSCAPLVRRATGLEPSAYIPPCTPPQPGDAPPPAMVDALGPLAETLRTESDTRSDVSRLGREC